MKKTKNLLFALIITTAFFVTTNVFAATSRSLTIVFHPNNGQTGEIKEVCQDSQCNDVVAKLVALQIATPTRDGYTFAGWYTDQNLTTPAVDYAHNSGATVTINSDVTWNYYAKWINNSETGSTSATDIAMFLKLIIDDDTTKEIKICDATSCEFEKSLKKINLPTPEKEGYKFEGWYLDEEYTAKIKDTTELLAAIEKTKIKADNSTYTDDDSVPVEILFSGSGNLEEQTEKSSFVLYAKWSQVVKTGNTGINKGLLLIIIGSLMIGAGSAVIYKKTRNNN